MVGHTHEDIDQTFSCLSRYLRKHDALTMSGITEIKYIVFGDWHTQIVYNTPSCVQTIYCHFIEMEACCKAANHTVRETSTLKFIFDIKTWISPYLEEIHGHTTPHVFLFRRNVKGKACMYTKTWSHQEWEPEQGLQLLKVP